MKTITACLVSLTFFSISCRKPIPSYYVFDFELNNSYQIESSGEIIYTPNAYIDQNSDHQIGNSSITHFRLTDGLADDTLNTSCGNWDYINNPTTNVKIWFPFTTISDGIYDYNIDSSVNDFGIYIYKDMIFSLNPFNPTGDLTIIDTMTSVLSWSSNIDSNSVKSAKLKVENINETTSSVKYVINMIGGEVIKGAYNGNIKKYVFRNIEGDCD